MDLLSNYYALIERVDDHCLRISGDYEANMVCKKGCDDCCRRFTLFPVEAQALYAASRELSRTRVEHIRERARDGASDDVCPLLDEGECLLYEARPIICRTHGLPILTVQDGRQRVDVCPLNFKNVDSLPASSMIDIDRLNTTLTAINGLFVKEHGGGSSFPERIRIVDAVLGKPAK